MTNDLITDLAYNSLLIFGLVMTIQMVRTVLQKNILTIVQRYRQNRRFEQEKALFVNKIALQQSYQSYPSAAMQRLLHSSYGLAAADIIMLQITIDWYLPVIQKRYLYQLQEELQDIKGIDHLESLPYDNVAADKWSQMKSMLRLLVSVLEHQYDNVTIQKQRIDNKNRSHSESETLIETASAFSAYSDESFILSHLDTAKEQPDLWIQLKYNYIHYVLTHESYIESVPSSILVVLEIERFCSDYFFESIMQRLTQHYDLCQQIIIAYTYENPSKKQEHIEQLTEKFSSQFDIDKIILVDMVQPKKQAAAELYKYLKCTEQALLFIYPEQYMLTSFLTQMLSDISLRVVVMQHALSEGLHPEHFLQAFRLVFRLKDSELRRQWRDFHEEQEETALENTASSDIAIKKTGSPLVFNGATASADTSSLGDFKKRL